MKLPDFKALSFDCYGTLIDWETGLLNSLASLCGRVSRDLTRSEILQTYARQESRQQKQTPSKLYSELMAIVFKRMAEEWGTPASWGECLQFGESLKTWPAFPDSTESLTYLKKHYKLIILSNVDNESFAATNETLGITFDAVYTAQDIGSYKPDEANFHYMIESLERIGIERSELLHTAQSLFHDHEPANRHGITSCWIDRQHDNEEAGATPVTDNVPRYDFRFQSLAELVAAHRAEAA